MSAAIKMNSWVIEPLRLHRLLGLSVERFVVQKLPEEMVLVNVATPDKHVALVFFGSENIGTHLFQNLLNVTVWCDGLAPVYTIVIVFYFHVKHHR